MGTRTILALGLALLGAAQALAQFAPPRRAEAEAGLPPGEFAGTLMLGGLRGLACDLLWMRAVAAKEAGRFYESVALAEAITRVQPRFVDVWQHLAHDLAYNIAYEADGAEQRFSWFMAGVRANARGSERNPEAERLLRHLAWMYHHKGDSFHTQIEGHDQAAIINPLLALLRRRLGDDPRLAPLPAGPGNANFAIAHRLYAAAVALGEARQAAGGPAQPSFVRRMVAHTLDADGNRLRNRGEHLAALRRWLAAGAAWDRIQVWIDTDPTGREARAATAEVLERSAGRIRRKAAELATVLAPDAATAAATAAAILAHDWAGAERLLDTPGWSARAGETGQVRWLDEP